MSMHKKPLTPLEEEGLRVHHLTIGAPSQLSDAFRIGMAWAQRNSQAERELNTLVSKISKVRNYCELHNIGEWGSFCTEELIKHCDALVAQVAAYKERSSQLNKLCDELIDHLRYNKAERDDVLNSFWAKQEAIKHVPSDPQQCIAKICKGESNEPK